MRLHIILREPYTPKIQPAQGQHGFGLASLRARLPLGYGHVPLPSLPGTLPGLVIRPGGCGGQQHQYQHSYPYFSTPSHGGFHSE